MEDRTAEVVENGFAAHVLVCTNERDSEYAACAEAQGQEVLRTVKTWLRDRDLYWSRVHVAETSCLGLCSAEGTAIAIHPRSRWYSGVLPVDVPELLANEFGLDGHRLEAERGRPSIAPRE